jgi:hypothetical protein
MTRRRYPTAVKPERVGRYPALAKSGGGFVWDEVLEYRVWCHPEVGAEDLEDGSDYFHAFATYPKALAFAESTPGADAPIALIRQKEYINEAQPGVYVHVKKERVTEWPVEFLHRPKRDRHTIPDFFAADAPANRLDILRGLAKKRR